jgi:hypothetical protein
MYRGVLVMLDEGVECVQNAPDADMMTAELYVTLQAQGRVSGSGLCTFGTKGRGLGVVTYRLDPRLDGTVRMVRALPFGEPA